MPIQPTMTLADVLEGRKPPPPRRKSMRSLIRENREGLTEWILAKCPNAQNINDRERELWILNDESLYNWARSQGVDV